MTAKRPSGGQRTAAERQAALRARREQLGLVQVPVWVPNGFQKQIREIAADLRAAAQTEGKVMYDVKTLARAIEMASDAAYDEDAEMDVRWEKNRGLYTVLREYEDGGRVLWSTDRGTGVYAEDIATRIIDEETERREMERG